MMKPLTGLFLAAVCSAGAAEAKPTWHTDLTKARAEAKRTGKPLFVVFRCQP